MRRTLSVMLLCMGLLWGDCGYGTESDSQAKCPRPKILSIDPAHAEAGDTVTILGRNLGRVFGVVKFTPEVDAPLVYWSQKIVVAKVPSDAETGYVTVTRGCGATSKGKYFVVGSYTRGLDVYVSETTGSDLTGDGTIDRPWQTINHAALETWLLVDEQPVNINVAAGTYRENVQITTGHSLLGGYKLDFKERKVQDRERQDRAAVIEGKAEGPVVEVLGYGPLPATVVISGFTIHNGLGNNGRGSGISCNGFAATISDNAIKGNKGRGILACNGAITNNTISENQGGIDNCAGAISGNSITNNFSSQRGGGLQSCSGPITNNSITDNVATVEGGGLYNCSGRIEGNIISRNSAYRGAGLSQCNGTITNNTVAGNTADWLGGGFALCKGGDISHNTVSDNSAGYQGGGFFECGEHLFNNTIRGNSATDGGGLAVCYGTLSDNLIFDNKASGRGGGLYHCEGMMSGNTVNDNHAGSDGGGFAFPLGRIDGGSVTGNHADGLGGGICYTIFPPVVTIAVSVADNTSDERPTVLDCPPLGLYVLLQEVDNSFVYDLPWYQCITQKSR